MNDAELDDSWAVAALTWVLYLGWLSVLAGFALWIGVEPLPSVQAQIPGWGGTVAALAVGVAFILVSRQVYDALRRRYGSSDEAPSESPAPDEGVEPPPARPKKKRKRKKKKKR